VFETLGIRDVVAKSTGTQNPYNMVRATIEGLKREDSPRRVASRRGMKVAQVLQRRGDVTRETMKEDAKADAAPAEETANG